MGEHGSGSTIGSLMLISMLALVVPMVLHRLKKVKIPVMVGEIVCGIIIGKGGFNIVDPGDSFLNLLSLIGFTYLMFLGGMEIDFTNLTGGKRKISNRQHGFTASPLFAGSAIFIITLGLCYAATVYLRRIGMIAQETNPIMLALLLSTTSVGVVLPTLKESKTTETPYGQVILTGAMISDFATIFLATVAILLMKPKGGNIEAAALLGLFLAFYIVYLAGARIMSNDIVRRIFEDLSNTSAQLRVRMAFALMLFFTLMSQVMGVEVVLGAFVAGAMFRVLFRGESLTAEMNFDAIGYGFLIPVFFIMVGVRLDIAAIWASPHIIGLMFVLLIISFIVKLAPSMILAKRFGIRDALAGGFILSGRLSLIIAFAEIAVIAGLLQPELEAISIFIAIVTCVISPMLFLSLKSSSTAGPGVGVCIIGAGKVGRSLARRLRDRRHLVTLIDNNPKSVAKAREHGMEVFLASDLQPETLENAGIRNCNIVVAATGKDMVNFDACMMAKDHFKIPVLAARVGNPKNMNIFQEHGIRAINTTISSVVALENIMYRPVMYSLLAHEHEGMEVVEIVVTNKEISGRRLMNISLPGDALVLLIRKGAETFIPHGKTVVEAGDSVTLFMHESSIMDVKRKFDPESPDLHVLVDDEIV